jgi:hypothetical protein
MACGSNVTVVDMYKNMEGSSEKHGNNMQQYLEQGGGETMM